MKIITEKDETILIKSPLLTSVIKQEVDFSLSSLYEGKNNLPDSVLSAIKKRLDVPLPLDKSFVHEAIKEYSEIEKIISSKAFTIVL